jgi:hypothetical protein
MNDLDLTRLVDIVATGIRVLVKRGTCQLTEDAIYDRARNIVQAVIVNFELRALPAMPDGVPERIDEGLAHPQELPALKVKEWARLDFDTPLIDGRPIGHTWSCQCTKCHTYKQTRRSQ